MKEKDGCVDIIIIIIIIVIIVIIIIITIIIIIIIIIITTIIFIVIIGVTELFLKGPINIIIRFGSITGLLKFRLICIGTHVSEALRNKIKAKRM